MKLLSNTIAHKTDVDGVRFDLHTPEQVRAAFRSIQLSVTSARGAQHFSGVTVQPMIRRDGYELILGSSIDPQFGPVILFGSGGVMVEVYRDHALGLPPLNTTLAQRLMEQTRIFTALHRSAWTQGREPSKRLQKLLVRFSQLVLDQPWIKEIDINPLLATAGSIARARCTRSRARRFGDGGATAAARRFAPIHRNISGRRISRMELQSPFAQFAPKTSL